MLKIENVEVLGWEHAIRGMRNPKNSWEKIDSFLCGMQNCDQCPYLMGDVSCENQCEGQPVIGPNDHKLMMSLAAGGPVHAKYRRMITVYLDITAPLYWWKEFDTYKIGTVANSCSTMHKIHAKEFTLDDFSGEHLVGIYTEGFGDTMICCCEADDAMDHWYSPRYILENFVIKALNVNRDNYNKATETLRVRDLTDAERKHIQAQLKCYWWQMIQLLPTSYNQKRTVMLNYEVLHNMYESRRHHKLDEWHVLCDWIEQLPYAELITMKTEACE